MSEIWLIRSTFAKKDEAISVSRTLLEEGLIACANIDERMTALFRWEGRAHEEAEAVLLAKTSKEKSALAMARIKALHSYRVPGIVCWKVEAEEDFAQWVNAETGA